MHPTDLRVRALELALEASRGCPTGAAQHVAAAELFLDFLAGKQETPTIVNFHWSSRDAKEEFGREVEKAIRAAKRSDGRSA